MSSPFAENLEPPYYAVIFSSTHKENLDGYEDTAGRMVELAASMPGYLGIESVSGADGFSITVSYWRDEASIAGWRTHAEHLLAQERGKRDWYERYELRIARVERARTGPPPLRSISSCRPPCPRGLARSSNGCPRRE
jgi:heme-degrading monooxygenase HmoA